MLKKIRSLFYGSRRREEIDREISTHLAMEIEHRQKGGMSAEEARRTALRDFGGVEKTREEVRDARGITFWDVLRQDVRFGLRSLRRSPGYALSAILILALGIGVNTAMFSVINGVLLKPLPFRSQSRIALLQQSTERTTAANTGVSINELYSYRERLKSIEDLVEYHQMSFTLLNEGEPDRVDTGVVSANFFEALGVAPLVGRNFVPADAKLGAQQVVLLTYEYWQSKFGADPKVVNKVVQMNNATHLIVGVLPPFPQYPQVNDIYMPTSACPFRAQAEATMERSHRSFAALSVFGWLAPGATLEQASAEIAGVASSYQRDFAQDYPVAGFTGAAALLSDELVREARPMLLALSAATVLVLILACANVANLALARTARRGRELAVRSALGAGKARLVRQLVTESLILSTIGGVLGVIAARGALVGLVSFIGRFTERTTQIAIDPYVLGFATAITVITGVICGIAPALASRKNLMANMRDGAAQAGESSGRHRFRASLVVAQVGVSFVLLIGSGLLLESVYRMAIVPLGYDTEKVMNATFFGNFSRFQVTAQCDQACAAGKVADFQNQVLNDVRSTPGVAAAAITNAVPLTVTAPGPRTFSIVGRTGDASNPLQATPAGATDGYFETLGVPVLRGRVFTQSDTATTLPVLVINDSMAKFWEGEDPVGSVVRFPFPPGFRPQPGQPLPPTDFTVIGVVGDFRLYGPTVENRAQYYRPLAQTGGLGGRILVRASGNPEALGRVIADSIHRVDPQMPVEEIETLYALKLGQLEIPAVTAGLLSVFAAVALAITLAGIAGLIGTAVTQRSREFGVRLALGAKPWSLVGSVVVNGLKLVAVGIAIGLAGAYGFNQVISRFLFATKPTEAFVYVTVGVIFLAAAALAAFAPAKRVTAIDPLKVLKAD
jgi:putative ABC transport system permease protein